MEKMLTKSSGYTFVQRGKAEDDNLPGHTQTVIAGLCHIGHGFLLYYLTGKENMR